MIYPIFAPPDGALRLQTGGSASNGAKYGALKLPFSAGFRVFGANGANQNVSRVCGRGRGRWHAIMLHSSISSIGGVKVRDKQLIGRGFQRFREMEAKVATGEGMER